MQRWLASSSVAIIVSFFLFVLMAKLIAPPTMSVSTTAEIPVTFASASRATKTEVKIRTILEKHVAQTPPKSSIPALANDSTALTLTDFDPTSLIKQGLVSLGDAGSGAISKLTSQHRSSTAGKEGLVPIIKVMPQYPIEAARQDIEGYVKLRFTIDNTGRATDIEIIEAKPKRVFDSSAKQALKRWRYSTKFVNGEAVKQPNQVVQLDYNLEDNGL